MAAGEFLLYQTDDGLTRVECRFAHETLWRKPFWPRATACDRCEEPSSGAGPLDEFLRFNERRVLPDAGSVSKKTADAKALAEFEGFAAARRHERELLGEADSMKALEQAARALEAPTRKPGGNFIKAAKAGKVANKAGKKKSI